VTYRCLVSDVHYTNASAIGSEAARAAWALAAREALIETAQVYNSVITYKALAEYVQTRTLVRTKQLTHHWIGDVLGRVAVDCGQRGEPILSALCVDSTGSVGAAYANAVRAVLGDDIGDADDHAAAERLACYGHFGAHLPPGGGVAALTPALRQRRERARKSKAASPDKPLNVCPTCNTLLPASGVCDYCD
jgi:hypothetical protein